MNDSRALVYTADACNEWPRSALQVADRDVRRACAHRQSLREESLQPSPVSPNPSFHRAPNIIPDYFLYIQVVGCCLRSSCSQHRDVFIETSSMRSRASPFFACYGTLFVIHEGKPKELMVSTTEGPQTCRCPSNHLGLCTYRSLCFSFGAGWTLYVVPNDELPVLFVHGNDGL